MHWGSWEKLCRNKLQGSLGFRNLFAYNQALIAKQCWSLYLNPNSLAARVLKGCYHSYLSFLKANHSQSGSFIWRSLFWGRELLENGSKWCIERGSSALVCQDRWLPRPSTFKVLSRPVLGESLLVSQLKLASGEWNVPLIERYFSS
ncbi:hypothetical protein ACOSQ3_029315 [Xanthoceras sorbifolium]